MKREYKIIYIDDNGTKQTGIVKAFCFFSAKFQAIREFNIWASQILGIL